MQSSREQKRDEKAFLNELCKEIEENNKMGKTRALFRNARMSMIKDRMVRT